MTESNFRFISNVELNEIPEARFRLPVLEEVGYLGNHFYSTNTNFMYSALG
jgi:hypothetical protein